MGLMKLLEWQYLIFVLPFIAGLLYLFIVMSGLSHDMDHDVNFDHDVGVEHDIDAHAETDGHWIADAFSFLGLGKVPFSIVIMSLLWMWGFSGWASNEIVGKIIPEPFVYAWISLGIALFCSVTLTRWIAIGISKVMPGTETHCISEADLVGKFATAKYSITENFGSATLYDEYDHFQEVTCRVEAGEEKISAGTKVVLVQYNAGDRSFFVRPDRLTGSSVEALTEKE